MFIIISDLVNDRSLLPEATNLQVSHIQRHLDAITAWYSAGLSLVLQKILSFSEISSYQIYKPQIPKIPLDTPSTLPFLNDYTDEPDSILRIARERAKCHAEATLMALAYTSKESRVSVCGSGLVADIFTMLKDAHLGL